MLADKHDSFIFGGSVEGSSRSDLRLFSTCSTSIFSFPVEVKPRTWGSVRPNTEEDQTMMPAKACSYLHTEKQKIIQLNTFYFWMELRNSCPPPVRRRYGWYWNVLSETHQWSPPVHSPPPAAEAAVTSAPANWYCAEHHVSPNCTIINHFSSIRIYILMWI